MIRVYFLFQLLLLVQSLTPPLVDHAHMICNVLDIMCNKAMKQGKEPFGLKLHYLSFALKEFGKYDSSNPQLKKLVNN